MIYFCADDYGISKDSNYHIEKCFKNSVLNKISVLPNGEISDFKKNLSVENKMLCLHINLVEGKPLSNPDDIKSLVSENGFFKYSFISCNPKFCEEFSPLRRHKCLSSFFK